MKYAAIDLETTGLDPKTCQILQIAVVVEDTEKAKDVAVENLPTFCCFVDHDNDYRGEAFALQLNSWIFKILAGIQKPPAGQPIYAVPDARGALDAFFIEQFGATRAVIAGKNAANFDLPFLRESGFQVVKGFHHRVIDVGSVFIDWTKKTPPGLPDIIQGPVAHNALDDARDVIRALRKKYL